MTQSSLVAAVGRLLMAVIFIMSGIGKIAAPEATQGYIASVGLPLPVLSYWLAVVVELVGGVLLVAGYQARLVSLALAGFTLVAALAFHNNLGDQNQMIHFLKNVAMAGGLLQITAFGGGAFSVDGRRSGLA